MAHNWPTVRLGDVADVLTGFPFKSDAYTDDPSAPRLLRGDNIGQGLLRWDGVKRWPKNATEGVNEYWLAEGDVILAMDRPWIEAGLKYACIRRSDVPALLVQRVARLRGTEALKTTFLKYVIGGQAFTEHVLAIQTGTAVPHISTAQIKNFEFRLPPLREQDAIAHILSTFDNKIELNRRMNETLDAIARALFKSWFLDFDPVRAKAEGRDLKGLTHVFPDSFEYSELGATPSGWSVASLADHFDAVKGVSYKGSELAYAGVPLHNLNSIYEGGGYKYEGIKYYSGEYAERHLVTPGDVIVANTEQGHDRLLIGYAAIVPRLFGAYGIVSHHVYRLRPKPHSHLTAAFLCHLLNSDRMHRIVSGYANGTTVNMLPPSGVQQPLITIPPEELVGTFDRFALQVESRREEIVAESRNLGAIRDTLLPKLISGELRLKDARKFVERAI